jgi:hypothetical protein
VSGTNGTVEECKVSVERAETLLTRDHFFGILGEEKVSGTNGTVEMLSARGLALDWAAVFYKTCPARVSFAN